ncbi:MAG: hypothetical protein Q4C73_00260, partial [Eubacteriales bacterium]|nr:hypothetical protein [Eubacteriales bacterium]
MIPDCSALRAYAIPKTFALRSFFFEKRLPVIPDCSALRAYAIPKTFAFRSFFFEKRLPAHVLAGNKVKIPPASKLASDFSSLCFL